MKILGLPKKSFTLSEDYDIGEVGLSKEPVASPVVATNSTTGEASMSNEAPAAVSVAIPQTVESMGSPNKDFIINELNFEIKN